MKKALLWITDILKKHDVPFQITGGLAAIAYGSSRSLVDIDIDIPDAIFDRIQADVLPYTIFGPSQYKDENWQLLLQTLDYQGQLIDLSGADSTKIFNKQTNTWQHHPSILKNSRIKYIYGLDLPIINKQELIEYKSLIAREVDLIDIAEIAHS